MRKVILFVCVLYVALASFGCGGPQVTDAERTAPPAPGAPSGGTPRGNSAGQPPSGPHGSPGG